MKKITTQSGTIYLLINNDTQLIRIPNTQAYSAILRKDYITLDIETILILEEGFPAEFILKNVSDDPSFPTTHRITTTVESIEEIWQTKQTDQL